LKTTLSIAVVLAIFFAAMYFTRDAGYLRREKEMEKVYAHRIDSIRSHFKTLLEEDSVTFVLYGLARQQANEAQQEALILKAQLAKEVRKNRHFNDKTVDSLLSIIK
jgi:hypothetical protein